MNVSATTLHIGFECNYTGDVYVYRFGGTTADNWDSMGDSQKATLEGNAYGRRWYSIDMNGNNKATVRFDSWNKQSVDVENISGDDCYIYLSTETTNSKYNAGILASKGWQNMKFSNDVDGQWDDDAPECTKVDDNTFTYTLTKAQITQAQSAKSGMTAIYFRYKLANGVFFVGDYYWNDHYYRIGSNDASNSNVSINIAESITNNSYTTNQEKSWYVSIPSYDYEKLVFTIQDVTSGTQFGNSTWKVTVDAYISKTIGTDGVATFGSAANVDFSKAEPALTSAKKGKVQSNGTITWNDATTLYGGEGALIEGTAGTYSIPVAASASADTEHNDFVAITSTQQITQSIDGKNAYILAKVNNVLGFYKPASGSGGSWCGAGTAYLATTVSPASARGFFPIWDDTTGIDALQQEQTVTGEAYNLAGQRVTNPTKGLYIVNGKKIIKK